MVKRFWQSGRSGIYFSVVEEGDVAAGDPVERIAPGPEEISVADVVRLYLAMRTARNCWSEHCGRRCRAVGKKNCGSAGGKWKSDPI